MTVQEKMHSLKLYVCDDAELMKEQAARMEMLYDYNATRPSQGDERTKLLKEMFAEIGEGCYIEPPLRANWAGKFCHFGKSVYANFNLTLVDDTDIFVGDGVMFGPNVVLATAGHPVLPELRRKVYQFNAPIRIGSDCWLGAGVIVLPGVTIGEGSVIGAGSVVTKDIPPFVVAVGNPCRVLRPIGERDKKYFFKDFEIDYSDL